MEYPVVRVIPEISVDGTALEASALELLEQAIVDSNLHLPWMFEVSFLDTPDRVIKLTGMDIGSIVKIRAPHADSPDMEEIIEADVTSIEASYDHLVRTVVRGYSFDHRLQRVRRSRSFVNMSTSDIARKIAKDAGLKIGKIDDSQPAHPHLGQVNQTDWDFLAHHARAIGFETGVVGGEFVFQVAGKDSGAGNLPLEYRKNLLVFKPRVTSGNLAPEAEVRVWDPVAAKVVTTKAPTVSDAVALDQREPAQLAGKFGAGVAAGGGAAASGSADYGPAPSDKAYIVADWPLAQGAAAGPAADEAAQAIAGYLGSSHADAEGVAVGDSRLLAGVVAEISAVSDVFSGSWVITGARHVFGRTGYLIQFEVSGAQDRSLLGLASGGSRHRGAPSIPGVVCAIVTNINDPETIGRVKVTLPWLSPLYESDWAPVVQIGGGKTTGAVFMPEVGDQVLVGFDAGDPRRAYVLGGVRDEASTYDLGGPPVKARGQEGQVVLRGFVTPSGNRLAFNDEVVEGQPPTVSKLDLGTGDGSLSLVIDQTGGTVSLTCKPAPPNSKSAVGSITIECGDQGTIDIKTGMGGTVNIDGGNQLNLKAMAGIKLESQGIVEIKGGQIKLN